MTWAPALARARTVARPMPRDPPVTSSVLLLRSNMMFSVISTEVIELVCSAGALAAVDTQYVAGQVGSALGGRDDDGGRDFLRPADALLRGGRAQIGFAFFAAGETVEHAGIDRAGGDGIDADAIGSHLQRYRCGQAFNGVFAGDVDRRSSGAPMTV